MQHRAPSTIRDLAKRLGFVVRKSRTPKSAKNLGQHMLCDIVSGVAVLGENFSVTMTEIDEFLMKPKPRERGPIVDPNPDPRPIGERWGCNGFPTYPGFNACDVEKEMWLSDLKARLELGLLDAKQRKMEAEFAALLMAPVSEFGRVPVETPRRPQDELDGAYWPRTETPRTPAKAAPEATETAPGAPQTAEEAPKEKTDMKMVILESAHFNGLVAAG